jgi:hypothetical protein
VKITATDSQGATGYISFMATFTDQPPTLQVTSAPATVAENTTASASGTFSDYDDAVTITASVDGGSNSATGITQDSGSSGNWSWSAAAPWSDGLHTVTILATNADGSRATSSFNVIFTDVAPTLAPTNTSVTVNEGQTATNSGSFSDYDDAVTITASQGTVTQTAGRSGNWSWSQAGLEAGNYTINITAVNADGSKATASFVVKINDVPPIVQVSSPPNGVPGQPRTFTFSVTDPSPVDQAAGYTYTINWGDSTSQTIPAASNNGVGVAVDHVYTAPPSGTSYTVQVTATGKDDNIPSAAVTASITIQTVQMEGNTLAVGGTLRNDTITLTPADGTGDITVNVNGTTTFNGISTFKPTDHILVYGQAGNDTIQLVSNKIMGTTYYITVPAFLYGGGTGNEILSVAGSTANNVVTGGGGTNQITGGLGRDILIAGLGASKLFAGNAGDILIGGWTDYDLTSTAMTYDKKLAALEAIMAEWGRTDLSGTPQQQYNTRVSDLQNGGGLNGSSLLNASTVHENGQADTLSGIAATAPLDWFFVGATDIIKHNNSGEAVTNIS